MNTDDSIEVLLFKLAGAPDTLCAINLYKVLEIVNGHSAVSPPLIRHPACVALADLREHAVPVIDLSQAVFGTPGRSGLWLWCEFARRQVAFEVAEVLQLAQVPLTALEPADRIAGFSQSMTVTGVLQLDDGRLATLLDVDAIMLDIMGPVDRETRRFDRVLTGKRVLFADDSRLAREQVRGLLEALGADVIECVDGEDATRKLTAIKQACGSGQVSATMPIVVTDVEMPRKDGYSLVRSIRADPALAGVRIVMYSSLAAELSQQKGRDCGADEFIAKFSDSALADAITRLVM
jgi:two-component system chemotaxis response regulator CheV